MFWFNKIIIREPTVCASLKLQYWCQLKYFVIELFGRAATRPNSSITNYFNYSFGTGVLHLNFSTPCL